MHVSIHTVQRTALGYKFWVLNSFVILFCLFVFDLMCMSVLLACRSACHSLAWYPGQKRASDSLEQEL